MAKWIADSFNMFEEIYDWTDGRDSASPHVKVVPGELIKASVTYKADDNSYDMNMTASPSGTVRIYRASNVFKDELFRTWSLRVLLPAFQLSLPATSWSAKYRTH